MIGSFFPFDTDHPEISTLLANEQFSIGKADKLAITVAILIMIDVFFLSKLIYFILSSSKI
ncbi:MAG: hypothetical protein ACFFAJ_09090 [Candidatus Hodarchaeota archaeon]